MEKTIYEVYVEMQSQAQCDRMKQLCLDNRLSIWDYDEIWEFLNDGKAIFCSDNLDEFWIMQAKSNVETQTSIKKKVTEQEFIELLKNRNHD